MPISENVSSEREHLDSVAINIIVSALDSNELLMVSKRSFSKEMWNTLEEYHKNPRNSLMDKEDLCLFRRPRSPDNMGELNKDLCLFWKSVAAANITFPIASIISFEFFEGQLEAHIG